MLLNEYDSGLSEKPSSPSKFRLSSAPTPAPTPEDSVLMLRAKGNGDRQVVVDGGGGRSAAPLLSPPPLQEQGSLPSQDAHTAGGALNPPPLPGGALEALPPSQLVDARSPPPSGRFMPLHELPGLSLSTPLFPAPRAPIPPSTPPPTFCLAGDGLRMSRQWCW